MECRQLTEIEKREYDVLTGYAKQLSLEDCMVLGSGVEQESDSFRRNSRGMMEYSESIQLRIQTREALKKQHEAMLCATNTEKEQEIKMLQDLLTSEIKTLKMELASIVE